MRLDQRCYIPLAMVALTAGPAFASTQSHDFGPHTKEQISAICTHAGGRFLTSPGKWGCRTVRWSVQCVSYGKTCTIELLGLLPTSSDAAGHAGTMSTTAAPQQGTGLSGNGGAGAIGGKTGGGTKGSVG